MDEHANRMMSVRALNVNILKRYSPGQSFQTKPRPRQSLLSLASDFIVQKVTERQSKLRAIKPKTPQSPVFKPVTDADRQSNDSDANLSVDEDEKDMARYGHSAHRCSMIKKYNLDTYFLGPSPNKDKHNRPYL